MTLTLGQDAPLVATPGPEPEWIPFRLVVHHRKGLRTDRLSLRLSAPAADGSDFDTNIYLRSPASGSAPLFTINRAPDGWTVLDGSDLGTPPAGRSTAPGEANITLDFTVKPLSLHPAEELYVEIDAEVSDTGTISRRSRTATGRLAFPFVRN
ncbi:hypothetical protein [Halorientalis salina]|uniref:hypothetical protein n=1 Tax=Halorientalis salina TaxID=2932266 RepID=UPI0010AD9E21|nr:hypothetical protein [Halorientalis salina]